MKKGGSKNCRKNLDLMRILQEITVIYAGVKLFSYNYSHMYYWISNHWMVKKIKFIEINPTIQDVKQ